MKPFIKFRKTSFLFALVSAGLLYAGSIRDDDLTNDLPEPVVLKEAFHTSRDEGDNVDSPAVWHGRDGENWLLATAKEGNVIIAYDAASGEFIERFGSGGSGPGQFRRPNGISVIDDLLLVVERDNHRVQVLRLPDFRPIGMVGEEDLIYPYGITVLRAGQDSYEIYVTDNYNPALEGYPAEEQLDERIRHYRFSVRGNTLQSELIREFGEIDGPGMLLKVESIYADPAHNRLLIADEAWRSRNVKVYDLEGNFTGEVIPSRYFLSEPEGIALYGCEDGSGYWIITDQDYVTNKFEVFDRETLRHLGTFMGEITLNTDGVWLTQTGFGPFPKGAFYPVHDDGSMTGISWEEIATALSLNSECTQ